MTGETGSWPTYQGENARTGYAGGGAPEAEPKKPPWAVDLGHAIKGGMAVADGMLFHEGEGNSLVARNIETGEEVWTFDVSSDREGRIEGNPTVADGTVYVGSEDEHCYAIDAETGDKQWEYELADTYAELTSAPTVGDGLVFFGGDNETLHAVDAATGEEEWTLELEDNAVASPLYHDGRVYVGDAGSYGTTFYAVDPEFGIADWEFDGGMTGFEATAAADEDTIYVPGETGPLYALDPETGDVKWETECPDGEHAPVVADGSVYFVYDNGVRAVDAETGEKQWTFETSIDWTPRAGPAVAEGVVYLPGHDDILYAIDAETGDQLWEYETGEIVAPPVVAEGAVVYGTHETSASELAALTEGANEVGADAEAADETDTEDGAASDGDAAATVDATAWATEQGENARTGYAGGGAPEAEPKKPPWAVETGHSIDGGFAVVEGVVYHPGDYNTVVARDLETGEEQWTFESERDGKTKAAPAVAEGTVYVGSTDEHLYALDAATGDKRWEYELDDTYAELQSTPTVAGGTVYFGGENETVHAVDAATGEEEWTLELEDNAVASPLYKDGRVYIGASGYDTTFYAIDPEFGVADWKLDGGMTAFVAAAAADEDTIYVPGETGPLYALDPETGDVKWEAECPDGEFTPAVADGSVYFVYDNGVRAVDAETGEEQWTFETSIDWTPEAPPAVAEGIVYLAGYDDVLYAVDADTGEELWAYETGEITAAPVVAEGAVVYGTHETTASEVAALTEGASEVGADTADTESEDDAISVETGKQAAEGDWPTRQGTSTRSGYAGGGTPDGPPKKAPWNVAGDESASVPPAISQGALVLPGEQNTVVAYDIESGAELWTFEDTDNDGRIKSGAAIAGDTVYVGSEAGFVYALDLASGKKQWEYELEGTYAEVNFAPAVRDGVVYFGGENETFHAVDAATGEEQWTMDLADDSTATPVVHQGRVYFGTGGYGTTLHAVDPALGVDDWTFDDRREFNAAPAAADGVIYAPSDTGPLYALDAETGDVLWEGEITDGDTSPAVADGRLFHADSERIRAFDAETGEHLWDYEADMYTSASPAVAEGTVYVGIEDEQFVALDAATGEQEWSFDRIGDVRGGAAVADGAVFVASREYEENIYALTEGADPVEADASVAAGDVRDAVADADDLDDAAAADGETEDGGDEEEESLQEALDRDDEFLSLALDRIDDPQNPVDDEIQAAILGVVNDEWVTGTHQAVLRSDVIGQQIAERVPGATEGLVRHNVEYLAEEGVIGGQHQNRYILVRSRPASVDWYQHLTDERIIEDHELLDVLEPLYERHREQPRDAALTREELQEATFLDEDDLDRLVWYLDNAGKWVEDILLTAGSVGYVDTIQTNSSEPWIEVELTSAGTDLYSDIS